VKRTVAVKVRLARPLSCSWNEVGSRLRELSWLAHHVLNGTITRLVLSDAHPDMAPKEWRSTERPHAAKNKGGKLGAYPMAKMAIERANTVRKEAVEDIPSAIQNGWARTAERRHKTDRRDVAVGAKAVASFRSPAPICITSSGDAWTVGHDGTGYWVDVPLHSGGASTRTRFALAPDGRGAHEHMRRIVSPSSKLGDMKILAPKGQSKKKWVAVLSYSYEADDPTPGAAGVATLTLDQSSNVVVVCGKRVRKLFEGSSVARQRGMFAARRASRSRHQRDIGAGARGHGRARALEHYHAVDDAEGRWMRSICQEIAAKASREAMHRGASWVVADEAVGRLLPPAMLRDALDWALTRAGLAKPKDLPASTLVETGSEASS
jgi:hypothetical protein